MTTSLCRFCQLRAPLISSQYCCAGCETFDQLLGGAAKSLGLSSQPNDRDRLITANLGFQKVRTTEFQCAVEPLACEACFYSLAHMPQALTGLNDIKWNRSKGVLTFSFMKGSETPSQLFGLLEKMQLRPQWNNPENPDSDGLSKNQQRALLRLGVTGALAGNMMLFAVPIYGGLSGSLATAFEWIQFLLFLPILVWSASPFYRTSWSALRLRKLNADLPLTIAFVIASVFSIYSLLSGDHQIYFDSLAGFLFLILASRYFLDRSLAKHLEAPNLVRFFSGLLYQVQGSETHNSKLTQWADLKIGDQVLLKLGDKVPADGRLLSFAADFETAWMTGEIEPVVRLKNSQILAGTQLSSEQALIELTSAPDKSEFAQMLEQVSEPEESLTQNQEARIGTYLLLACFLGSLALLLLIPSLGLDEWLRRSVALWIIACPCAISFAAPLARARSLQIAFRRGFWLKTPHLWEQLAKARKFAFDKTGTLTGGVLGVHAHSPLVDTHWKKIILSLENISHHPIAEALRRSWGPFELFPVSNHRELSGQGVSGEINGIFYELRSSRTDSDLLRVSLYQGNEVVLEIDLDDEVRPGVEKMLQGLGGPQAITLLSGDRPSRTAKIARELGLPAEQAFGGLSPQEKREKIKELKPDVFFGDGINDVLAADETGLSVAMAGASPEAMATAKILMVSSDVRTIPDLFTIARETIQVVQRNLGFAVAYNFLAGTAALLGYINPLMAAVLMPLSSFILLMLTFWGTPFLRRVE